LTILLGRQNNEIGVNEDLLNNYFLPMLWTLEAPLGAFFAITSIIGSAKTEL
jgi:hypothetical protein